MREPDSIRRFFEALERHDLEAAIQLVGEGFTVQAPGHFPLSFKDYCRAQLAVWRSFPDLSYNASGIQESLSLGSANVRITGTVRHDLAMPWTDMQVAPATGQRIALPPERLGFTLEWGEILTIRTQSPTAYGLLGVVREAGLVLPPPGIMG